MLLKVLFFCLCIWSSSYLLQSLLSAFGRETPYFSLNRCLEAIPELIWVQVLHASCYLLRIILKLACLLWILKCPGPSVDSLSFVFSNIVLELKFVCPCPTDSAGFLHTLQPSAKAYFHFFHWEHTQGDGMRSEACIVLKVHIDNLRILWVRYGHWFIFKLLDLCPSSVSQGPYLLLCLLPSHD